MNVTKLVQQILKITRLDSVFEIASKEEFARRQKIAASGQ